MATIFSLFDFSFCAFDCFVYHYSFNLLTIPDYLLTIPDQTFLKTVIRPTI